MLGYDAGSMHFFWRVSQAPGQYTDYVLQHSYVPSIDCEQIDMPPSNVLLLGPDALRQITNFNQILLSSEFSPDFFGTAVSHVDIDAAQDWVEVQMRRGPRLHIGGVLACAALPRAAAAMLVDAVRDHPLHRAIFHYPRQVWLRPDGAEIVPPDNFPPQRPPGARSARQTGQAGAGTPMGSYNKI